jgi:hypothetical protein
MKLLRRATHFPSGAFSDQTPACVKIFPDREISSADVANPARQIDSAIAKVLGRGRYERQNHAV